MHLKSLDMIGFKSFADKARLEFGTGLTAIVGPNGCGKSNVSDAIRWVLGEQSARTLRGSSMEDCIFNGTDVRKPLGMAEVSITFAGCEKTLGTDFNEVTVSRRVFRSGEGQYFINKTPCRLKDIQRLFMDTGIGTTSYSVMEQGRIDRVLSARPEDRRAVFEEASGITKFKSDKKEAMRKLDQTEANLLRLADVIREVKRQIGSLQRQAGAARRYEAYRKELRGLDLHLARRNLGAADDLIRTLDGEIAELGGQVAATHAEVAELDTEIGLLRESLARTAREIGGAQESAIQAEGTLRHTRETIDSHRQRVDEYAQWATRDSRELSEIELQLEGKGREAAALAAQAEAAEAERDAAGRQLAAAGGAVSGLQQQAERVRSQFEELRAESVEMEGLASRLQNELGEIESSQRSHVLQRERLSVEKAQLARHAASGEKKQAEMAVQIETLRQRVAEAERKLADLERRRAEAAAERSRQQQALGAMGATVAARQAHVDLLVDADEARNDYAAGTRRILDGAGDLGLDPAAVLGSLAAQLDAEPEFATATEAALRAWLDAVIVRDAAAALAALRQLAARREGPARVIALGVADEPGAPAPPLRGTWLVDHVRCPADIAPALRALIGRVAVVESLDDVPWPCPGECAFVTREGVLVRGSGAMEFWMADPRAANPLSRKHVIAQARAELDGLRDRAEQGQRALGALDGESAALDAATAQARAELEARRRDAALQEGQWQIVSREAAEASERLETVGWELENLGEQGQSQDARKQSIAEQMAGVRAQRERIAAESVERAKAQQEVERRLADSQAELTECRVRFAEVSQRAAHLGQQREAAQARLVELRAAGGSRSESIRSYEAGIRNLREAIARFEGQLAELDDAVARSRDRAESLKKNREKQAGELHQMEAALAQKRDALEQVRGAKSALDVQAAESRIRRQNLIDRVTSEYSLSAEQIQGEPEPEWEAGPPPPEEVETRVAELRAKLEAMGPVNLVAIQEFKEHQERYDFLTAQEQDLIKSKEQLRDMIRKIDRTTTEMFRSTFEKVNENFGSMFQKLFDGGSAKLVLANEEDLLESGIEIIARPPGKRLQNVSLLSGGERTMTAVALLFAIYLIKPSPFCLLDELDAALDDSNIGRFVKVLQGFLDQSQFLVITHNRQTIAAADTLYGVTMPEKGISKLVSMRFNAEAKTPAEVPAG